MTAYVALPLFTDPKLPLGSTNNPKLLESDEKAAIITDIVLGILITTVGALALVQITGLANLGPLSCLGTIGQEAAYTIIGVGAGIVAIDITKFIIQTVRHISKLQSLISSKNSMLTTLNQSLRDSVGQEQVDQLTQQLKSTKEELQAAQASASSNKGQIDQLTRQLNETKAKLQPKKIQKRNKGANQAASTRVPTPIPLPNEQPTAIQEKSDICRQLFPTSSEQQFGTPIKGDGLYQPNSQKLIEKQTQAIDQALIFSLTAEEQYELTTLDFTQVNKSQHGPIFVAMGFKKRRGENPREFLDKTVVRLTDMRDDLIKKANQLRSANQGQDLTDEIGELRTVAGSLGELFSKLHKKIPDLPLSSILTKRNLN